MHSIGSIVDDPISHDPIDVDENNDEHVDDRSI